MARRRGKHVLEARISLSPADDDGSFSAALVVAGCLAMAIVSAIGWAFLP